MTGRRLAFSMAGMCGAALFVYSIRAVGVVAIVALLEQVGWGFTAILFLSGGREVCRTLAWMRAIEGPVQLRFWPALRARLAGEALSTLLPMGVVVGEPTKAAQVSRNVPVSTAFKALALEWAFYCASLTPLLAGGALTFAIVEHMSIRVSSICIGVIALAAAGLVVARSRKLREADSRVQRVVAAPDRRPNAVVRTAMKCRGLWNVVSSFASRHPERVWTMVALETVCQICAVAEVYVILTLISPLRPTLTSALVLETVNRVIAVVFKIMPMRVGVDETSAAWSAGRLALGATTGVSLALVRKLRLLFWSTVGLVLLLVPLSESPASLQPAAIGLMPRRAGHGA